MGTVYQGQPPFEAREAGRQVEGLFESLLQEAFA